MVDPNELAELLAGVVEVVERFQRQHDEDERLLQEAQAALSLGPVRGVCSWCGLEFLGDADPASRMKKHLYECPKHPMRAVEEYAAALKAIYGVRTQQYRDALRGIHRDTMLESFMAAAIRLEKAEAALEASR